LPPLPALRDWTPLERLEKEFEAVGFYLSAHPLDTKKEQLERLKIKSIQDVEEALRQQPLVAAKMAGVLLKKMERMSQKGNKYAFLQLSDSKGVYEVMVFSDTLTLARDLLEVGETLLLQVTAEVRDEQARYTAQSIQKLNETLEKRTDEIHITLTSATPARKLKQFLDIEGAGPTQIILHIPLETDPETGSDIQARPHAEIILPSRYNLSTQARNNLRGEDGVVEIREV
jgi:DNA polymerase-3 subunit alpha